MGGNFPPVRTGRAISARGTVDSTNVKENRVVNDRTAFRLASSLIFGGELLFITAGIFHPDRVPANQHPEVFAEYANSVYWGAVHMGQFAGYGCAARRCHRARVRPG